MKAHRIPENLKYLLKKNGMSCNDLFLEIEFLSPKIKTMKQISAYKEGANEPRIDVINVMAKFFGLSIEDFCYKDLSA
jgi:transcriptional regulator with XRE-family HTH domain